MSGLEREGGGGTNPNCDFSNAHRDFQTDTGISPANFIILKALGSDKSSVKFESLKWVANRVYNRK